MLAHVPVGTVTRVVGDVVVTRGAVVARRTVAHVDAELAVRARVTVEIEIVLVCDLIIILRRISFGLTILLTKVNKCFDYYTYRDLLQIEPSFACATL